MNIYEYIGMSICLIYFPYGIWRFIYVLSIKHKKVIQKYTPIQLIELEKLKELNKTDWTILKKYRNRHWLFLAGWFITLAIVSLYFIILIHVIGIEY